MASESTVVQLFSACVAAIRSGQFIQRQNAKDKEFHFQDWVSRRIHETGLHFETGGRNSYPDFRMVNFAEGYEVKGLAQPGREDNYDCNSQAPTGQHNGRTIFYVFGRYPAKPEEDSYPVTDLVICHGDFLNADHDYIHRNKHVKGFGSYGDIMIRDRKMYVAPTPFGLLSGVAYTQTLILPEGFVTAPELKRVGTLTRTEAANLVVGYRFDLLANQIALETVPNPSAGLEHRFEAWRLDTDTGRAPSIREQGVAYHSVSLRDGLLRFDEIDEDE
jgi:hypothetical protein